MKKLFFGFLVIALIATKANGQDFIADSLKSLIENPKSDSIKASAMIELANYDYWTLNNHYTFIKVLNSALSFAKQKGLIEQQVDCIYEFGYYYSFTTDTAKDLNRGYQLTLQALSLARQHNLISKEINLLLDLSNKPGEKLDSTELLIDQALSLAVRYNLADQQINALTTKGNFYVSTKKQDSAKIYFLQAFVLSRQSHLPKSEMHVLETMAYNYIAIHWAGDSAKMLMHQALTIAKENHFTEDEIRLLEVFSSSRGHNGFFFLKDSLNTYYERIMILSLQLHRDTLGIMGALAFTWQDVGNFPKALQNGLTMLHAYEERKDTVGIEQVLANMIELYQAMKDYRKSIDYCNELKRYGPKEPSDYLFAHIIMADDYLSLKQNDSARCYADQAYQIALNNYHNPDKIFGGALNDLGIDYIGIGEDSLGIDFLRRSYYYFTYVDDDPHNYAETLIGIANYFNKKSVADSVFYYARLAFGICQINGFLDYLSESSELISNYYHHKHNIDSAYYYQQIGFEAYKSLYNEESNREFQNISFEEQQREQDVAVAKKIAEDKYRSRLNIYLLLGGLLILSILAIGLWRRNIYKQRSFALLQKQKLEIDNQKTKVEQTLDELKSTQTQLIQSEKMASLGELTAGIAHEIQNPLNFVNNFSEVNSELIKEMKQEIDKGNLEEVKAIADNIDENEQKILHHGKRADAIVKGMLQHSRSSSNVKEPTNINALADEYLRLSYHGLRAKDKSFNANFKTDFDESIGNINIVPQDIGRVLLNLYNNAFYAVTEKAKKSPLTPEGGTRTSQKEYEPTVTLKTLKTPPSGGRGAIVLLTVKDNGKGIPQKVIDKIFQPFFTTKPTGEGTGLGLSLSYDIIKAHGGEIKVETKEGEGSEFIILLPVV